MNIKTVRNIRNRRYKMAVSRHTRKGKVRRHKNRTLGSHLNGKRIGCKMETYLKQIKKGEINE